LTDLSAAKSSFIRREVDVWGSLRSLRTSLAGATARLSQQGTEAADLRLLYTDLRAEAAAARVEAAAARAEVQRQQSEFDQIVNERDQSRGRAAEAESRAGALAADLAVA
jgi:chromosome segregation ATPase